MAELLNKIPSNLTEYPNSFKRQGAFPLEAYSVFYTMEAAETYAASNPISYVGQTLAVVTANAVDPKVVDDVTFYIIADAAGTLQEVGKATNGDDNSITLKDGVLSLTGFEAAGAATLPQKSPVYKKDAEGNDTEEIDHYELKWVTVDAIVEGDGNTKSVIASDDTKVIVTPEYNAESDTYTYKVSLDLSAYATSAAVGTAIKAVEDTIGKAADGDVAATGLYAVVAAAEANAKAYTDEKAYDDTDVKDRIKAIEDDYLTSDDRYNDTDLQNRVRTIETTIGDAAGGIRKELNDLSTAVENEIDAREQGDTDTLAAAKTYTNEEITGLDIVIEKKTVDDAEADYIVIKNKSGVEVASVNAAKFVKDGMLDSATYSTETKKLTLTWNTDAGKNSTEINLNDLVNTYTGSEGIDVSTEGVISIKGNYVALKSDLTALAEIVETKQTETQVNALIDAKIATENLGQYAKASDVETALADKLNKSAFDTHVEDYAKDKATFALKDDVSASLDSKVDVATYNNDKGTYAKATEVAGQFTAMGQKIDNVYTKEEADGKFAVAADVARDYATKTELKATDDKTVSNASAITNLTSRLDGIVAQGGEPNVINNIKVNGVTQTIAEDKSVDITVPVIANTKVSDLSDGQSVLNRISEVESTTGAQSTAITDLQTKVNNEQTGLTILNTRVAALEAEVKMEAESRIDAIEAIVNGSGENTGLVGTVAAHTTDIVGLKAEDVRLDAAVKAKANASDVYTKTETYTKDEVDAKVQGAIDAIPEVDFTPYVKNTEFNAYKTATADNLASKANEADVYKKSEVYTKTEADAQFMTEAEVDARINTLIDAADSDDTITNVANLVEYVNENAGDIAQLITDVDAVKATLETHTSAIEANTAAHEQNASDIAALVTKVDGNEVKASAEIEVTALTGDAKGVQLSIKEVNVNKLTQTEGDTLILNGGTTTV